MSVTTRILACSFVLAAAFARPARALDQVSVMRDGRYKGVVQGYTTGPLMHLNGNQIARALDGKIVWAQVSGRVTLRFGASTAQFLLGKRAARIGDKVVTIPDPVIRRSNQVFLPVSLFETEAFGEAMQADAMYNPRAQILNFETRASLQEPTWFSYPDHTRIVVEHLPGLKTDALRRGARSVDVVFPGGVAVRGERVKINDGFVRGFQLVQNRRQVRLNIDLVDREVDFKFMRLDGPPRAVIDLFRERPRAFAAAPAVPAPAPVVPVIADIAEIEAAKEGPQPVSLEQTAEAKKKDDIPLTPEQEAIVKAAAEAKAAPAVEAPPIPAIPLPLPGGKRRIVIDAGHGGKDPGAIGRYGLKEGDITLQIAKRLAALLRQEERFDVRLTRDDNTFLKLSERSNISNESKADLFISIHCNANNSRKMHGFEVYFLSEKSSDPLAAKTADFENEVVERYETAEESKGTVATLLHRLAKNEFLNESSTLAGLIAKQVGARDVGIRVRGVKQAGFWVLRGTYAPAVLIETGFLTNVGDATKLSNAKFQRQLVNAIYGGILDYARRAEWDLSGPTTVRR